MGVNTHWPVAGSHESNVQGFRSVHSIGTYVHRFVWKSQTSSVQGFESLQSADWRQQFAMGVNTHWPVAGSQESVVQML